MEPDPETWAKELKWRAEVRRKDLAHIAAFLGSLAVAFWLFGVEGVAALSITLVVCQRIRYGPGC